MGLPLISLINAELLMKHTINTVCSRTLCNEVSEKLSLFYSKKKLQNKLQTQCYRTKYIIINILYNILG